MGKVTNTFIKSKLNKDLDARILPNGEYRDAQNVQVSRSEGANVGSLENALGNNMIFDFAAETGNQNLLCIGYLADDTSNGIYVFLTDYTDPNPASGVYSTVASNYIYRYDIASDTSTLLVQGNFLNFSKTSPIYGINLLEDLLFWTDNRNQPRKINVDLAAQSITYYINEDQISVAKYNPYRSIEMFREITAQMAVDNPSLLPGVGDYQTTMVDVTSKYFPNGGSGDTFAATPIGTSVVLSGVKGDILAASNPYGVLGAEISYIDPNGAMVSTGATVDTVTVNALDENNLDLVATSALPAFAVGVELIFNPNPYYDENFAGDPNYLEDLFVRFSYRFRFDDGEYSIFAPFTQVAFIPKQDGYFMYVKTEGIPEKDDQTATYRSTVVSFVENKVDDIKLMIPLPDVAVGVSVANGLKVTDIDILYKESDGLAVKVIETIKIENATILGDAWIYNYQSIKPFKTLPSDEIIRVYDKTPVRALAQEIISNRVVYGNYQNKHTPPASLNYNVAATEKSAWNLLLGSAVASGVQPSTTVVNITGATGTIIVGSTISGWINEPSAVVTVVSVVGAPPTQITTDIATGGISDLEDITFNPPSEDSNRTSVVEYPNHSLKQNRSYQVGVVLSDRYGRQSTVILSNNKDVAESVFGASTIYSPYIGKEVEQNEWRGESLKVLFNDTIGPATSNLSTGWPGLYNGDASSSSYNPLGWYTYKIVVKQTEQEYYNVYLGGIMAAYPEDTTLEIGNTSHVSLINDNINKVPRDLTEVGPDQKQYRSSVELFGRVENMSTVITYSPIPYPNNIGVTNEQYFPAREADTVSTISTLNDLFDYDPTNPPKPNYYPQLYLSESNPLVARISTESKIGQIATTNYAIASATVEADVTNNSTVTVTGVTGTLTNYMIVTGPGIPENTILKLPAPTIPPSIVLYESDGTTLANVSLSAGDELSFAQAFTALPGDEVGDLIKPGLQYLAVYETEPVQSNLDIFWETSTSGIISDLNTLILNSTGGGFGIDGFNTNDWNEAILVGEDILSTPFRIVDNFGATITGLTVDGVGVDSISLPSVINQVPPIPFTQNVQLPDASKYFELYQSPTPDFFNIRVTSSYWDDIYFGDDSGVRNFTFNIQTTVGGVETTYPEDGNPNNIGVTLTPITYPCNSTIVTTRHVDKLVQLHGINGCSNPDLRNLSLVWEIVSQRNTTTNTDTDFFAMTDIVLKDTPDFVSESWLSNTLPGDIPAQNYQVVVKLSDPGNSDTCLFNFQMGVTPISVVNWTWTAVGEGESQGITLGMVMIGIVNPLAPSQDGFYIPLAFSNFYQGSFQDYVDGEGGGPILSIDGAGPYGCYPLNWIKGTTVQDAFDQWQQCAGDQEFGGGWTTISIDPQPVDVSAFEFEVIP